MTPQELKIAIGRGTFRGVPLWFFMTILTLSLLMIALVLARDSNKNKSQEKSKSSVKIFQIFVMIIAVWLGIFIKLSSHVDLVNSSTGERITVGTYWEVRKVKKDILRNFKEKEKTKEVNGEGNSDKEKKENTDYV